MVVCVWLILLDKKHTPDSFRYWHQTNCSVLSVLNFFILSLSLGVNRNTEMSKCILETVWALVWSNKRVWLRHGSTKWQRKNLYWLNSFFTDLINVRFCLIARFFHCHAADFHGITLHQFCSDLKPNFHYLPDAKSCLCHSTYQTQGFCESTV